MVYFLIVPYFLLFCINTPFTRVSFVLSTVVCFTIRISHMYMCMYNTCICVYVHVRMYVCMVYTMYLHALHGPKLLKCCMPFSFFSTLNISVHVRIILKICHFYTVLPIFFFLSSMAGIYSSVFSFPSFPLFLPSSFSFLLSTSSS